MNFLSPLGLIALGALLPLAALYFRKRQRTEHRVSSLALWRAVTRERLAATGLKRFRGDLSFWLLAASVVCLALALARPVKTMALRPREQLVLVLDTTASMGAREGGATRLDLARGAALALAATLSRDTAVRLVSAGCRPVWRPLDPGDPNALRAALAAQAVEPCGGDLAAALTLAADALRDLDGPRRVVALTDGSTRSDALVGAFPVPLELVRVGTLVPNVGVVSLGTRERPGPTAALRDLDLSATVQGVNRGAAGEVTATLSLRTARGVSRLATRVFRLATGRTTLTFPVALAASDDPRWLELHLDAADNALALDDDATLAVPDTAALRVRLVSTAPEGSPWVARALAADPEVLLTDGAADPRTVGLTVYHGGLPSRAPLGNSLGFLRARENPSIAMGFALRGPWQNPRWVDVELSDPRVRFVSPADVHFASAHTAALGPGDEALATLDRGPFIVARSTAGASTTLVGADPDASDWPLRVSFVLFLRDAVEHARTRRDASRVGLLRTGALSRFASHGSAEVTLSEGAWRRTLTHDGREATWFVDHPGAVTLDRGRGPEALGVSLLDATETALAVADLPWQRAVTGGSAPTPGGLAQRPLWPLAAALALGLLTLDAALYHRLRRSRG